MCLILRADLQALIRDPSRTVLVTVKGDSMVGAGIHEGGVVVVVGMFRRYR